MSAPVSRVFIRHSTIHDSRLSDTAIAVWLWLRRDPRSDNGAPVPLDYKRLSARTGLSRPRLRDALRNLAEAGAITRTTYRHGPGRGGDTTIQVMNIPGRTDRSLESVPAGVFTMLRSGALTVQLLRTWLRTLAAVRGRLAITLNLASFAERWGVSVRTVRNHVRSLVGLELLDEEGPTSTLRVPWMRWWGNVPTQPATQQRRGKNSVRGRGKNPSVNFVPDEPSRQLLPAGALATAQQSVPRETWPDKPAEKKSASSGRGGRAATTAEKRLDRWMDTSAHLAALRGPGRWSVRSVLAKAHRKMPTEAQAALLTRVVELLADERVGIGAAACRGIIRAARVQVIAELKAGTTTQPSPCRPRDLVAMDDGVVVALLSRGHAAAPPAEPWRYTGPPLEEPDLTDPGTDPGQIHAWIWSAMSSHADRSGTPVRAAAAVAATIRRRTRTSRFADDIAVSLTLLTQLFNQHTDERTAAS